VPRAQGIPAHLLERQSLRQAVALMQSRASSSDVDPSSRTQALKALAALAEMRAWGPADAAATQAAAAEGNAEGFAECSHALLETIRDAISSGHKPFICSLGLAIQALIAANPWGLRRLPLPLPLPDPAREDAGAPRLAPACEAWVESIDGEFTNLLDLHAAMPATPAGQAFTVLERAVLGPARVGCVIHRALSTPAEAPGRAALFNLVRALVVRPGDARSTAAQLLAAAPTPTHLGGPSGITTGLCSSVAPSLVGGLALTQVECNSLAHELLQAERPIAPDAWSQRAWAFALLAAVAASGSGEAMEAVPSEWIVAQLAKMCQSPPAEACGAAKNLLACLDPLLRLSALAVQRRGAQAEAGSRAANQEVASFQEVLQGNFVELAVAGAERRALEVLFLQPRHGAIAALASPLARLRSQGQSCPRAAAALLRSVGEASLLSGQALRREARAVAQQQAAPAPTPAHEGLDEYDYMERESASARLEEEEARLMLEALNEDPFCRFVPCLAACATDHATPCPVRCSAVTSLGRIAQLHPRVAEGLLPTLAPLCARSEPAEVRSRASLAVASLVASVPRLVEPLLEEALRAPLREEGTPALLRRAAGASLLDLCAARKLRAATELPLVLPCLLDPDPQLAARAWGCVHAVMKHEGSRWCRLAYAALLPLCHTAAQPLFARLVALLLPTVVAARAADLAQVVSCPL